MALLFDKVSHGVPAELTEVITLGRILKKRIKAYASQPQDQGEEGSPSRLGIVLQPAEQVAERIGVSVERGAAVAGERD